jgi:PEP-CTERM/exosortase A-associated glycosyltransferase
MRPLHVLDVSAPIIAGYTSRARSILENQRRIGLYPMALTGLRQGPTNTASELIDGTLHLRTRAPFRGSNKSRHRVPGVDETLEMAALGQRIVEASRQHSIDILHAHSPILCGIAAGAAAKWSSLPSVYEIRAFWEDAAAHQGRGDERSARYAAIRALETRVARSADAVVVICEGIRRDLLARGLPNERIFSIPNGVDTARFVPRERDRGLAERLGFQGKTVIAYLGTLFRFEGVDLLLRALARLIREDDSLRGLIVGHGEAEPELRALHAALGLEGRVIMTGSVPPSEIGPYYSVADILCYPRQSHRITELTTPLKPLEAMSMKKAVVASDVGGLRELVTDGKTALLFKAANLGHLQSVLRSVASDSSLRQRLGDSARDDMVRSRDWRSLAKRYVEVYGVANERARKRTAQ